MNNECFALLETIANDTQEFILIYKQERLLFTNKAFNSFFGVSSLDEFQTHFKSITDLFVPHPSYFNAQKIPEGKSWFEAILALDPLDRVVSFLSQTHDPHAFSVTINEDVPEYRVVTMRDITESLIKRILIENNMNIDPRSHAYTKQYFLHVKQSFEDAALFNEKLIGLSSIQIESDEEFKPAVFVETLKGSTRENDMIVAWKSDTFLMAYLVENATNAAAVEKKLCEVLKKDYKCKLSSILQKEKESIAKMIHRIEVVGSE